MTVWEGSRIEKLNRIDLFEQPELSENFRDCYEKYYSVILKHVFYLIGNRQGAEDITQETFLRLYNTPPAHTNTGAWLSRVASNLTYNYIRDEKSRKRKEPVLEEKEESNIISIEDVVIKDSEIRLTRKILHRMAPRDRFCLLLKFSGYKYSEISEIANVEKNSVGQLLARAQEKFKKMYLEEVQDR